MQSGLINRVLPATELMDYAMQRAIELAEKPNQAVIESKRLMKTHHHDKVKTCILDEAKIFAQLLTSEESKLARENALKR